MKIRMLLPLLALCGLAGCGYESRDNELSGQVKKIVHQTPLICPDRYDVDLSMGIMKNGVGSMSTQDVWFTLRDQAQVDFFKKQAEKGGIVKVNYNIFRLVICPSDHEIVKAEVVE